LLTNAEAGRKPPIVSVDQVGGGVDQPDGGGDTVLYEWPPTLKGCQWRWARG
jgi:hypothetical protein